MTRQDPTSRTIPSDSLILGYGPMLPFALGAIGAWFMPSLFPVATGLTIIWGAIILSFLGGVRRGFGFGNPGASTLVEIVTMAVYVSLAGIALICAMWGYAVLAVATLAGGYVIVIIADYRAARAGNVPAYFAALRPPQMGIAVVSLLAILVRLVTL